VRLRPREVRAALGISSTELLALVRSGELPWPVSEQALEEYIARRLPGEPVAS
jgi:hypothetical protein